MDIHSQDKNLIIAYHSWLFPHLFCLVQSLVGIPEVEVEFALLNLFVVALHYSSQKGDAFLRIVVSDFYNKTKMDPGKIVSLIDI